MVVFGGCNAGNDGLISSVAKTVTERYGVATIGAVGQTQPSKDGRTSKDFVLNYKDENNKLQQVSLGGTLNKEALEKAKNILTDVTKKKEEMKKEKTETNNEK